MDEILLIRRYHEKQVTAEKHLAQVDCAAQIIMKQLERLSGSVSEGQKETHMQFIKGFLTPRESRAWRNYLESQNRKTCIYNPRVFRKEIQNRLRMTRYTQARDAGKPFLPAFFQYAPLYYKVAKCRSVLAYLKSKKQIDNIISGNPDFK